MYIYTHTLYAIAGLCQNALHLQPISYLSSSSFTEGGQICQFIKCLGLVFFHINVNKFITGSMCTITVVC